MDLLGLFLPFFTISFDVRAVDRTQCLPRFAETCSSTSSFPITRTPPSLLSKPPPSSRLRVLFVVPRVMSIYLSTDLSVSIFRAALPGLLAAVTVGFVCYISATLAAIL